MTRISNTSLTGKGFREEIQTDLRLTVSESDPLDVLAACIDQLAPTWDKECGSPLQAAKAMLGHYRENRPLLPEQIIVDMARRAYPLVDTAAKKAEAYAEEVMEWTELLRPVLRLNKPLDSLSSVRSKAWTAANEAMVAALAIRAIFDVSARPLLAARAAEIVGGRSPTQAKYLLARIEAS